MMNAVGAEKSHLGNRGWIYDCKVKIRLYIYKTISIARVNPVSIKA